MEENQVYYGASKPRIAISSLIQSGNNLFMILMVFVTYLATGGYGIAVLVAGYIASAMRIFDGITDPIVAWFVPSVRTRFGVARPVVFLGYLLQAVTAFLLFTVFPSTGNVVIYAVLYSINILGYTFVNQANEMLQVLITNDPKKRPLVMRYSTTFTLLTATVMSLYRTKVLFPKYGSLSPELLSDMSFFAIIVATIFFVSGLIAVGPVDNVESFKRNFHGATKFHLKDIWNLITKNRAFLTFFISSATDKLASQTASNSSISMLLFGVIIGNYAFSGNISVFNTIISLTMLWMATGSARKGGNSEAYIKWCWISIIMSTVTFLFFLVIDPTTISVSIIPTVIFVVLYGMNSAFKSTTNACVKGMQMDIVDYEFYLHGKYLGPLVGSVGNVLGKIVDSFSNVITASCLAMMGYVEVMPQQGDPATNLVFAVTMFAWLGLPMLGFIASLIAMHWYPLNSAKMKEIQTANKERKAKNTADYEAELKKA